MQVTGVTLLPADGCHRNGGGLRHAALHGNGDMTGDFGRHGKVTLNGGWCWGNGAARHCRLQGRLHEPLREGQGHGLSEVSRRGSDGDGRACW